MLPQSGRDEVAVAFVLRGESTGLGTAVTFVGMKMTNSPIKFGSPGRPRLMGKKSERLCA